MPRADNAYSLFVALTKIVLPIFGLGLLSSLFLLSNRSTEVGELPYSEVELEQIVESQSVLGPSYQTTLDNGSFINLEAQTARPILTDPGTFRAETLRGLMTTAGGAEITLSGGVAYIDQNTRVATIEDGLRIEHSDGYILSARGGETSFDGSEAMSDGDVVLKGPNVTITAGHAELRPNAPEGSQVVVFSGGVRVLYTLP